MTQSGKYIEVDPDWWTEIFDVFYLMTDARSVCNPEQTNREVDFLEHVAELNRVKQGRVLDLCGGQGRHSQELARRGYTRTVVYDYSSFLLKYGLGLARGENLDMRFVRGDARIPGLKRNTFSAVLMLGGSFGYFTRNKDDDLKLLFEAYQLLIPNGFIIIDLPDKEYVLNNFKPESRHTLNLKIDVMDKKFLEEHLDDEIKTNFEIEIVRYRELVGDIINAQEDIVSRGEIIRSITYSMRLYSQDDIMDFLFEFNHPEIIFLDNIDRSREGDFGTMTNRIIVKAIKPGEW